MRLHSKAPGGPERPRDALQHLIAFVGELEARRATYHVSAFHGEGLRVEVAVPDERWVATFFPGGRVAVEVFGKSGPVEDGAALARLLDQLGPPRRADG